MHDRLVNAIIKREHAAEKIRIAKVDSLAAQHEISAVIRKLKRELLTTEERKQCKMLKYSLMQGNPVREDVAPHLPDAVFYVLIERKQYEWDRTRTLDDSFLVHGRPMRNNEQEYVALLKRRLMSMGFGIDAGVGEGNWYRITVTL